MKYLFYLCLAIKHPIIAPTTESATITGINIGLVSINIHAIKVTTAVAIVKIIASTTYKTISTISHIELILHDLYKSKIHYRA